MKIVIAPDSFKESLPALAVCQCIQHGFSAVFPNADYHLMPLADGGDGTVDVLLKALNGERIVSRVEGRSATSSPPNGRFWIMGVQHSLKLLRHPGSIKCLCSSVIH